jgi:hypothetical protein
MEESMKMKFVFLSLLGSIGLLGLTLSCSTGEAAAGQILGASSEAPVFLACRAVSDTEIDFEFSMPVKLVSLYFSPELAVDSVEEGSVIRVNLNESPSPGERLTADLLVEDSGGNTINVLVPFRTRNNRIPALSINELRTEYSKPKAEFIELKMLKAGNLGAVRVYIAGNTKSPMVYEFPPVEVKEGEYVTLHLRTTEESNKDELGDNLGESGGVDSSPEGRDLWRPGSEKTLHKTDAVYLLDQDDKVISAILIAENPDPWWDKEHFAQAADFLHKQGVWKSAEGNVPGPADVFISTKTTLTRSICRDESIPNSNSAADWYITANSSATPGKPNSVKRYQ